MFMILFSTPFHIFETEGRREGQNWYMVLVPEINFQQQVFNLAKQPKNTKSLAFQAQDTYFFNYFCKFALEIFQFNC